MKKVSYLSQIDEMECTGCKKCEDVCPTYAITMAQKKAEVNDRRCVACFRCRDICPEDAVKAVARPEPVTFGVDLGEVDEAALRELCLKANLHPKQIICLCTGTRVREAAAAILKGAKSPEDIAIMTGAHSGCGLYCVEPMLRLITAHGVEITEPKGHRWYNITPTFWDLPKEVEQKYPGYFFEEDRKIIRTI